MFSEHGRYYSAYDDTVHDGSSYTAYSIWDTFRAANSLLTLFAPERIDGMVQALLQDYIEGGWMPKWPNPSYTNIMIGTHADSLVAEAIDKGFKGFDYQLAYEAVYKDAMTPPDGDASRRWFDREPYTPYEARAGLTYAKTLGFIPADKVSESASSTLEEAYDDYAVAQVAKAVGKGADYAFFMKRSTNYKNLFNSARGFMQEKNSDGTWGSPEDGQPSTVSISSAAPVDVPGVVQLLGGPRAAAAKLDEHFNGGHNRHDNEPSHHYGFPVRLRDSHGRRRHGCVRLRAMPTRIRPTACWATKIAGKCLRGMYSRRWVSTRSTRPRASMRLQPAVHNA